MFGVVPWHLRREQAGLQLESVEQWHCRQRIAHQPDGGAFVEIQGTAEGHAFRRDELDALLELAAAGIERLHALQRAALQSS